MITVEEENVGFINLDKCKSKSVGDERCEMREEKNVENIGGTDIFILHRGESKYLSKFYSTRNWDMKILLNITKFPNTRTSYGDQLFGDRWA